MTKWTQREYRLKKNHGWKAKPGHKIFVADRGAVRFDFPAHWIMEPSVEIIKFYDRKPPKDNCTLEVSVFRTPPGIDWSGLPLPQLLEQVLDDPDARATIWSEITYHERPDLELAWIESNWIDPGEQRPACSRTCIARGADVHTVLTMTYWLQDSSWVIPVWDEVLRSLQLGVYIKDPTNRMLS